MLSEREFIDLVSRMRELQREYFRTRDRSTLVRSKDLERQVDAHIKAVTQPALF